MERKVEKRPEAVLVFLHVVEMGGIEAYSFSAGFPFSQSKALRIYGRAFSIPPRKVLKHFAHLIGKTAFRRFTICGDGRNRTAVQLMSVERFYDGSKLCSLTTQLEKYAKRCGAISLIRLRGEKTRMPTSR